MSPSAATLTPLLASDRQILLILLPIFPVPSTTFGHELPSKTPHFLCSDLIARTFQLFHPLELPSLLFFLPDLCHALSFTQICAASDVLIRT